jgi:hypothetical protein
LQARALVAADADLSGYYNHTLAGGKWDHMMDQTHIGYTFWNEPPVNNMPNVSEIKLRSAAEMGVAVEGSSSAWPGSADAAMLPAFDAFNRQRHYIDVFNRGTEPFSFRATVSAPWIVLSRSSGTIRGEDRVWVSIDWSKVPVGSIMPVTAESLVPPNGSACLQYKMFLFEAGAVEVETILSPSLNFVPGRGLRYAISFDDDAPQVIDALAKNSPEDWAQSVKDSVRKVKSRHTLVKPGYHILKVWMVDPGIVLQKLMVNLGGVKPSYLGPPESYHRSAAEPPLR